MQVLNNFIHEKEQKTIIFYHSLLIINNSSYICSFKRDTMTRKANDAQYIEVKNVRVNNLKGISINIPRNQFITITGVSGSGKSSLAFDTLYAEGQRRYAAIPAVLWAQAPRSMNTCVCSLHVSDTLFHLSVDRK